MPAASPRKMSLLETQLAYEKDLRVAAENYARGLEAQLEDALSVRHEEVIEPAVDVKPAVTPEPTKATVSRGTRSTRKRAKGKKGDSGGGSTLLRRDGTPDRRTKAGRELAERMEREAAAKERVAADEGNRTSVPSTFSAAGKAAQREYAV